MPHCHFFLSFQCHIAIFFYLSLNESPVTPRLTIINKCWYFFVVFLQLKHIFTFLVKTIENANIHSKPAKFRWIPVPFVRCSLD
jgi:hypothetical protein